MSEYFGKLDARAMPKHFFRNVVELRYSTAVKADIVRQNYTVCPRYWYVNATLRCESCSNNFDFSIAEQKLWYEELGFFVDSVAKRCLECRQQIRQLKSQRAAYDTDISEAIRSANVDLKRRLIEAIDELCEFGEPLPAGMVENRRILAKQIGALT